MISIVERFDTEVQPAPRAARVLQDLRGVQTYEHSYLVRHPFGAYNVSLAAVARRGLQLVDALGRVERSTMYFSPSNAAWELEVLEATDHFLDSLLEHVDDCKGIIRSFFPSSDSAAFKRSLAEFKRSVEPYRDHIGRIDNHLKHSQGRLRATSFVWPGDACLGYFVEGVVGPNQLGPARVVHPDCNSAFSFNRDLAFHLAGVFFVGASLAKQLHSIDGRLTPLPLRSADKGATDEWTRFVLAVSACQETYFPGESKLGIPVVRQTTGDGIVIEFPSSRRKMPEPPNGSRVIVSYRGDGATTSFKVPYSHAA